MQIDAKSLIVIALVLFLALSGGNVPTPPPKPPDPPVVVDEKPLIDGDGLHVLIVEESDPAVRAMLPREQLAVITSSTLKGWFIDHKAEWKVWDQHMDASHGDAKWQAAMKIERASLPWLIVSCKGKPNFSGPLPATIEATMAILKAYE